MKAKHQKQIGQRESDQKKTAIKSFINIKQTNKQTVAIVAKAIATAT